MSTEAEYLGIVVGALGGAAVGLERQRSGHASGPHARFGGIRTFTMLGGLAGIAGRLAALNLGGLAIVLSAAAAALILVGYLRASRREIDATTEVAGLVVIGSGLMAGTGSVAMASGIIAVSTLVLVEKSGLHALADRINDDELRAAARFGVMAIVVLPLLPTGPIAALWGMKPRELWLLVLFFSGLSFAGYLARRIYGAAHGYPLAGLLGGLISSTNVTFTFARLSQRETSLSTPLAIGVTAACTTLFLRVLIAAAVLNRPVARLLLPYLVAPFIVGAAALAVLWRTRENLSPPPERPSNPLQLATALQTAALFQLILFAVDGAGRAFGAGGLLISGGLLGMTDVDALTISMTTTRSAIDAPAIAAEAIAVGVLANCLLKAAMAAVLGTAAFRRVTAGVLIAMAATIVFALVAL